MEHKKRVTVLRRLFSQISKKKKNKKKSVVPGLYLALMCREQRETKE